MTTTIPSSCATAVPGRGVAWIFDLVGRQLHARQADAAVGQELDLTRAGRGHDLRDLRAKALADLRQERLDAPLHQLRLVADEFHAANVRLLREERQHRLAVLGPDTRGERASGQCEPERRERLADLEALL